MKRDITYEVFLNGKNCAQSVLLPYIAKLDNKQQELLLGIASGFGGGMGKMQGKCGALTGAFMVIGLINSNKYTDNQKTKETNERMIKKFNQLFLEEFGETSCLGLLNCDINSQNGIKIYNENDMRKTKCAKYVTKAIDIIEEIIQ